MVGLVVKNQETFGQKIFNKRKHAKVWFLIFALLVGIISANIFVRTDAKANTSAASMVTLECSSNRVLFQKNANQRRPMASTTKIMTAITVLELCEDIEKQIRVPKEAVGVEGTSIYLQYNESLSIKDLLYGLMLQSGNDCAVALACAVSGSVEKFAIEMNSLARKIGAENTNFVNPHGLHHEKHYTTAKELGLIASYAMKNPMFREIVSTKKYTAPWEGRNYNRIIINKNKILNNYQGGNGVKTGYTKKAGRCLVAAAERNGMQVVSVVLNCGPMFDECMALMDRAFCSYVMTDIINVNVELCKAKIERAKQAEIKLGALSGYQYPLSSGEKELLRYEFKINESLLAPMPLGAEAGIIKVFLGNQLLFDGKLYTIEEAVPLDIKDYLKDLIRKWNQI